jgi:hypothetical protein
MVRSVSNGDGIQLNANIKKLGVTEQSEQIFLIGSYLSMRIFIWGSSHSNISGDATLLDGKQHEMY